MTVIPLNDFVLVAREKADEKSPGGIIIPQNAKEPMNRGTVRAVGRGKPLDGGGRREPEVKKGDRVLFGKYSGQEIELDGDKVLMVREEDILAVVE